MHAHSVAYNECNASVLQDGREAQAIRPSCRLVQRHASVPYMKGRKEQFVCYQAKERKGQEKDKRALALGGNDRLKPPILKF